MKRFKVSRYKLASILEKKAHRVSLFKRADNTRRRFKKIHVRAQQKIKEFISTSSEVITAKRVQDMLKETCRLTVSRLMISHYLKEKLGLTYKIIKSIQCQQNAIQNRLKR